MAGITCAGTYIRDSDTCSGNLRYNWSSAVAAEIIQSEWAPWPGYNVVSPSALFAAVANAC